MKRTMITYCRPGANVLKLDDRASFANACLCGCIHVTMCCLEHMLGWLTAYHVVSDVRFPAEPTPHSIVLVTSTARVETVGENVHARSFHCHPSRRDHHPLPGQGAVRSVAFPNQPDEDYGVPLFLDQLIEALRLGMRSSPEIGKARSDTAVSFSARGSRCPRSCTTMVTCASRSPSWRRK